MAPSHTNFWMKSISKCFKSENSFCFEIHEENSCFDVFNDWVVHVKACVSLGLSLLNMFSHISYSRKFSLKSNFDPSANQLTNGLCIGVIFNRNFIFVNSFWSLMNNSIPCRLQLSYALDIIIPTDSSTAVVCITHDSRTIHFFLYRRVCACLFSAYQKLYMRRKCFHFLNICSIKVRYLDFFIGKFYEPMTLTIVVYVHIFY